MTQSGYLVSQFDVGTAELEDSEYPGGGTVGIWRIVCQDAVGDMPDAPPAEPHIYIVHRLMLPEIIKRNKDLLEELERKMDDPNVAMLELPYSVNDERLNDAVVREVFGEKTEDDEGLSG